MIVAPFPPSVRDATVEYLAHLDNTVIKPVYDWHPANQQEHTRQHNTSYIGSVTPVTDRMITYRWESDGITGRITITIGSHQAVHITHQWHDRAPWYPFLDDLITPWANAIEKAADIDPSWGRVNIT